MTQEQLPPDHVPALLDTTARIVLGQNVAPSELPNLIDAIYRKLAGLVTGEPEIAEGTLASPGKPAVPINKSVQNEYLICLEDGAKLKMLKRYLKSRFNLTPDQYRARWGLPSDYPMCAPAYAKHRSELAQKIGLGQSRKTTVPPAPVEQISNRRRKAA